MMTVNEVSKLTGVSIRTLQYYDRIGLLRPAGRTDAGYRLYDDTSMEKLQQILLFRELEFSLKEIKEIVDAPNFDKYKALDQQINLLELKKEHLENLIAFARGIKEKGEYNMNFNPFDKTKIDEYTRRAKAEWGHTAAFKEYEAKSNDRSKEAEMNAAKGLMQIFTQLGKVKELDPSDTKVQLLVKKLQDYISVNYYTCTKEILGSLGEMYAAGGEFTENINAAGGSGTADFTNRAIKFYCAG
ncbi:MAG: MerR family transcriptional regulator [Lentihominibacter sp.]